MNPHEKQAHKRLIIPIQVCPNCLYWQKEEVSDMACPNYCKGENLLSEPLVRTTADATVRYE